MIARLMITTGIALALAGCTAAEVKIQREVAQADNECRAQGLSMVDPRPYDACRFARRRQLEVVDDQSDCAARGLQPGSPAMAQCIAAEQRARHNQYRADLQGYEAMMGITPNTPVNPFSRTTAAPRPPSSY